MNDTRNSGRRMTVKTWARFVGLFLILILASSAGAGDWPNWRGPHYNGSSDETNLPEKFSRTENVLWSVPLKGDDGSATPVVIGSRVFINAAEKQEKGTALFAICLDRDTGKTLWKNQVATTERVVRNQNTWASPSPASDGKNAFFLYGTGDLGAFDVEGKPLWSRNLQKDYGPWNIMWDYGSSPFLYKGKLYISVMHTVKPYEHSPKEGQGANESYLLCLDPATGRELWKHVRPSDAQGESFEAFTTPFPYDNNGREELLMLGGDYLTAHNPDTGEEYWRFCYSPEHKVFWRIVPSPVVADGMIIIARPKFDLVFGLPVLKDAKGILPFEKLAWQYKGATTDTPTPLYYQGRLYIVHDNRKIVTCLNPKTGEKIWEGDLTKEAQVKGTMRGSPAGADGKIYCVTMKGEVVVLKAGDKFEVLSKADLGGSLSSASVAIADQKIFIRTSEELFCIAKQKVQ